MNRLPSSLIVAFWLTGALWLAAIGHYYLELPPPVIGGAVLMAVVAATMEWLTGGEPPE